jgi:methyl-accepting chemotaxis protein
MDLDSAASAHTQWKTKLRVAINNKEKLDAAAIGRDDVCELGKWLHGAGKVHASKPAFADVVAKHKAFHAEAGKIAVLINGGKFAEADAALNASAYVNASTATVAALRQLKKSV